MRPTRLVTIAAATAAATLALGSAPVGAGDAPEPLPITVDPTSGPAGTDIAVSGTDCPGNAPIEAGLIDPDLGHGVAEDFDQSADDMGNWTASLSVPDDAAPGTTYAVVAECLGEGAPVYEDGEFVVTEDSEPPALPDLTLAIDPTSGPVGTEIGVSGDGCEGDLVTFGLFFGGDAEHEAAIVDLLWANPAEDGTWSGDLLVYEAMVPESELSKADPAVVPVEPGSGYFVGGWCEYFPEEYGEIDDPWDVLELGESAPSEDEVPVTYSNTVGFEVTGDGDAPLTEPLPPAPGLDGLTAPAQPASPIVGDPTYTG